MSDLSSKKCVPCEGGTLPLPDNAILEYKKQLKNNWVVIENKKIQNEFKFKDFKEAMIFVNRVAEVAELEGHHPDISIFYDKVSIQLWTHAIGGLSINDFIVASKIEDII